ncbi:replicative DNA helicase [Saccharomonospora piscinae]|uniref:replicative DNA helicase n=1 Tax=Saccharomonospora piscinae TaxID=687388 RepID=UPI00141EE561|nr:DnaB-like helicase C-terminal domain-containing protein [Saccharomonospora piscinae]
MNTWDAPDEIVHAERAVLGTVLAEGRLDHPTGVGARLLDICQPKAFHRPAHAAIAAACVDILGQHQSVDPTVLVNELFRREELERVGGGGYVLELLEVATNASAAETLANGVVNDAHRRRMHEIGQNLIQRAAARAWDGDLLASAVDYATEALASLDSGQEQDVVQSLADDVDEVWADLLDPQPPRFATGLTDLDDQLIMEPGDVTTLAARTSVGKSMVASTIAQHVAVNCRIPVFFAALEMSKTQMVRRTLAAQARVQHEALVRPGLLSDDDLRRLQQAKDKLAGAPLFTDYASAISVTHLRHRLRWLIKNCERSSHEAPGLVVVDYLGIMRATQRYERRQLELAETMQALRALASEFEVHMLVVHQLNRDAEGREPRLVDLRESGDIEQDSANVLLLHLPEESEGRGGELDILLAKNRHGRRDTKVTVTYQPHYQRVTSLARG